MLKSHKNAVHAFVIIYKVTKSIYLIYLFHTDLVGVYILISGHHKTSKGMLWYLAPRHYQRIH